LKREKKDLAKVGVRGMAERLPDEFLLRKVDTFFDACKDLVRALIAKLVETKNDQAGSGQVGATGETRPAQHQKLWTVAEIAEYLRVEPRTVYVWVREKDLPARKAGDELRFDPDEVERWTMRDRETEKIIEKNRIRALK
jgi:excisionase family DNA binding protein